MKPILYKGKKNQSSRVFEKSEENFPDISIILNPAPLPPIPLFLIRSVFKFHRSCSGVYTDIKLEIRELAELKKSKVGHCGKTTIELVRGTSYCKPLLKILWSNTKKYY